MSQEPSRLARTAAVIDRGLEQGLHIGAQFYASLHGKPAAELAVGECRPGVPMTSDSILLWLSASKPIGAAAILQLRERGLLELDDAVARHLPEFAQQGKESITLWHLLTHTAGFRWVDTGWPEADWDEIIARICAARPERGWVAGEKAGYHPYTSWYVLGEVIHRVDGRPFSEYVRQEIFEPLGMFDCWIGIPEERLRAYGDRLGQMPIMEKPEHPPHAWSTEAGMRHGAPGGGGHGPARELAVFYEMLLGEVQRQGVRLLRAESVQLMTARQRAGMFDETFKHVIDWGLGLILDSKQYGAETVPYGYGPRASAEAYGHSGSQSSVAFADPRHGLAAALIFNGMPGERLHQPRMRAALEALYNDLELNA